jgi:Secretion system C-terminal sorting domain
MISIKILGPLSIFDTFVVSTTFTNLKLTIMKKKLFLLACLAVIAITHIAAQCDNHDGGIDPINGQDFNDDTQSTPLRKAFNAPFYNDAVDIKSSTFDGTFVRVAGIVSGRTYQVLTRSATQYNVTVRKQSGMVIATGSTPLSFTPSSTDSIQIHVNKIGSPCSATFSSLNLQMSCTSCTAAPTATNSTCGGTVLAASAISSNYTIADPASPSFNLETTVTTFNTNTIYCNGAVGDDDVVWYSFPAPSSGNLVVRHGRLGIARMYANGAASSFIGAAIFASCTPAAAPSAYGGCKSTSLSTNQMVFTGLPTSGTLYLRMWSNGLNGAVTTPIYLFSTTTVPVELVDVKAKYTTKANQITWTTATERNAERFDIQRSNDGVSDWNTIGSVKAKGNSVAALTYEFADATPLATSYYRLQSMDFDGKTDVSKIVSVNRKGNGKLSLDAVNRAYTEGSFFNVDINLATSGNLNVSLMDAVGRVVSTKSYATTEGANLIQFNTATLANGMYILHLSNNEGSIAVKMVKQ